MKAGGQAGRPLPFAHHFDGGLMQKIEAAQVAMQDQASTYQQLLQDDYKVERN